MMGTPNEGNPLVSTGKVVLLTRNPIVKEKITALVLLKHNQFLCDIELILPETQMNTELGQRHSAHLTRNTVEHSPMDNSATQFRNYENHDNEENRTGDQQRNQETNFATKNLSSDNEQLNQRFMVNPVNEQLNQRFMVNPVNEQRVKQRILQGQLVNSATQLNHEDSQCETAKYR